MERHPAAIRRWSWIPALRLRLLAALVAGLVGALASPARAQDVCGAQLEIDYIGGPLFGIPGDLYTVRVGVGTHSITGGAENVLTVERIRFELDCANNPFIGCVDEGPIMAYVGDGSLAVGGTGCVDAEGSPVVFGSNNPAGGTAPNQLAFTPSAPVVLPSNVAASSEDACRIEFDLQVANAPGADGTPLLVQEAAGFVATPPFDALCDQDVPIPGTGSTTGQLALCRPCDDADVCTEEACNQSTGECETSFTVVCEDPECETCNPATGICEPFDPLPVLCPEPGAGSLALAALLALAARTHWRPRDDSNVRHPV